MQCVHEKPGFFSTSNLLMSFRVYAFSICVDFLRCSVFLTIFLSVRVSHIRRGGLNAKQNCIQRFGLCVLIGLWARCDKLIFQANDFLCGTFYSVGVCGMRLNIIRSAFFSIGMLSLCAASIWPFCA